MTSYVSTIGSTYLTVALLPVRPIYHTIQLNMCSIERIHDREQHVNNHEKTVIKRYETLDFARFSNTSFNTLIFVIVKRLRMLRPMKLLSSATHRNRS